MLIYMSLIEQPADRSKFERIYTQYKDLMFYIAQQILDDRMDAEDAVQQSFLKIVLALDKLEEPVCPKTKGFVAIIVKRTALDLKRKRDRGAALSLDGEDLDLPAPSEIDCVPEKIDLAAAMARLPAKYRDLLLLKYDCGYAEREIAQMLAMTEASVKKAIQRAKTRLGAILEEEKEETK